VLHAAALLTSSCALTLCRPAVTASICFCKRAMVASCSSIRRCALRNSLSNIAFTASLRTEFPAEVLKKVENFSETTEWRGTKSVISVSVFVVVFLKAERVVVLGFPDVLRNRRSEVLKNLKRLSEKGPHPLFSNESLGSSDWASSTVQRGGHSRRANS
jgi:hypothetical protein